MTNIEIETFTTHMPRCLEPGCGAEGLGVQTTAEAEAWGERHFELNHNPIEEHDA